MAQLDDISFPVVLAFDLTDFIDIELETWMGTEDGGGGSGGDDSVKLDMPTQTKVAML